MRQVIKKIFGFESKADKLKDQIDKERKTIVAKLDDKDGGQKLARAMLKAMVAETN